MQERAWWTAACAFCLLAFLPVPALVGGAGVAGYGAVPSARSVPPGQLLLYASSRNQPRPDGQWPWSIGWIHRPLDWLELGGDGLLPDSDPALWTPRISCKWLVRRDGFPLLSVGVTDILHKNESFQTFYFVGGGYWSNSSLSLGIDLGAMLQRSRNPWDSSSGSGATPFLGVDMDFGTTRFALATTYAEQSLQILPSLWWSPIDWEENDATLSFGAGYDDGGWGAIQAESPSLDLPGLLVEVSPDVDFRASATEGSGTIRLRSNWISPLFLKSAFLVQGVDVAVAEWDTAVRKGQAPSWQRSYAQWEPNGKGLLLAAGMLDGARLGGYLRKEFPVKKWNPVVLEGGGIYYRRSGRAVCLAELPLHPKFSGFLSGTGAFLVGGQDWSAEQVARLQLRQDIGRSWNVEAGVGGRAQERDLEASLRIQWHTQEVRKVPENGIRVAIGSQLSMDVAGDVYPYRPASAVWQRDPLRLHASPWRGAMRIQAAKRPTPRSDDGARDSVALQRVHFDEVHSVASKKDSAGGGPLANDRDSDGVPDSTDFCPDEAEDRDGIADSDGCPEVDEDQDGIADESDQCPTQPETWNRLMDSDGCPDFEDNDGIDYAVDACPDQPEDLDGWLDEDGCPDPDNDGDGIADTEDRCPMAGETRNGIDDTDGCPD